MSELKVDKSKYITDPVTFLERSKGKIWSIDTETTGFEPWGKDHTYSVQIMDENGLLGFFLNLPKNSRYWKDLFYQPKRHAVFFNAPFDLNFMRKLNGGKLPSFGRVHDTMTQFRMLDHESSYKLKSIVRQRLGVEPKSEDKLMQFKKDYAKTRKISADFVPYDMIPPRILVPYALDDVVYTMQLFYLQYPEMKSMSSVYSTETELIPIIADLHWNGIHIDAERAYRKKVHLLSKLYKVEEKIWKMAGTEFNLRSGNDCEEVLVKLGYKVKYNYKGNPMLDAFNLKAFKKELTNMMSEFNSLDFDITHYLTPMSKAVNGILHSSFNSVGAIHGRMASYGPNYQNLRRGPSIRQYMIPPEGHYIAKWDYDQIELKIMAGLARVIRMLGHIKADQDLHEMASMDCMRKCNPQLRTIFKTINYLIVYGGGPERLWYELMKNDLFIPFPQSAMFLGRHRETYPEIQQYFNNTKSELQENGYVTNWYGRRTFPTSWFNANTAYRGVNYKVSGTAADLLKRAMVKINSIGLPGRFFLPVHDELVHYLPIDEDWSMINEEVRISMEKDKLNELVPITVSAARGPDYGHLTKEGV